MGTGKELPRRLYLDGKREGTSPSKHRFLRNPFVFNPQALSVLCPGGCFERSLSQQPTGEFCPRRSSLPALAHSSVGRCPNRCIKVQSGKSPVTGYSLTASAESINHPPNYLTQSTVSSTAYTPPAFRYGFDAVIKHVVATVNAPSTTSGAVAAGLQGRGSLRYQSL